MQDLFIDLSVGYDTNGDRRPALKLTHRYGNLMNWGILVRNSRFPLNNYSYGKRER